MKTDGKIFQVATQKPIKKESVPRLPHERDESRDSQQSEPRREIRQAYDDLMSGMQDTDLRESRGAENVVRHLIKRQRK